jgi:hypothetical protein
MKAKLSTKDKLNKVEDILKYYRLRGVNKEKINAIKHSLLKEQKNDINTTISNL